MRCLLGKLTTATLLLLSGSQHAYATDLLFGTPYPLSEVNAPLTGDFSPSLSPDGRELYFMGYQRDGGHGNSDLWIARRDQPEGPFSAPENLGIINTPGADSNPDITGDGLTLLFDSSRSGGAGGERDIWVATRSSVNDPWGSPSPLGSTINTGGWEGRPSISANGRAIAFDTRHERFGRSLAVAVRSSIDDSFGPPLLLDERFVDGSSPSLTADGLTLFFARLHHPFFAPGGSSSLWMATRETLHTSFNDPVRLDDAVNSLGCVGDPDVSFDGTTLFFIVTDCSSPSAALQQANLFAAEIRSSGILGDFNANGLVEQADLDLVLSHWGAELPNPDAAGWLNDPPISFVDQQELDKVLAHWGSTAVGFTSAAAVPEPATFALALAALCAASLKAAKTRFGPATPLPH